MLPLPNPAPPCSNSIPQTKHMNVRHHVAAAVPLARPARSCRRAGARLARRTRVQGRCAREFFPGRSPLFLTFTLGALFSQVPKGAEKCQKEPKSAFIPVLDRFSADNFYFR